MNLQCGKHLPACRVVYSLCTEPVRSSPESGRPLMPSAGRVMSGAETRRDSTDRTFMPVALYRAVGSPGKRGTKLRRASEISTTTPGLDLATRLRVCQRALRSRVERREAFIDIV